MRPDNAQSQDRSRRRLSRRWLYPSNTILNHLAAAIAGISLISGCWTLAVADDADQDEPLQKNLTQQFLLDTYATPESRFAYLNRTLVHYRDEGRGPAVLLIHGSVQDLYDWDEWTKALSPAYRIIRLDLPGAGLTGPVGSGDYSIANTMRTIDQLMDQLDEERFAVVGTSLGGVVAFRYAATRPEHVAALVLMNSAGVEWGNAKIIPPQPQRYNESLSATIRRTDIQTILNAVIPDPTRLKPGRVERALAYHRREGRDAEAAAIVGAYDRGKPEEVLAQINAPVLVLWGGENRALDPVVADQFAAMLTGSPVVEKALVPGAGHWPHVEAPARSVRFVETFLDRHYAGSEPARLP